MRRFIRFICHGLRTRPCLALAISLGIFAASAAYSFTRPKIYEATASMYLLQPRENASASLRSDIVSLVKVAESVLMRKRVADHLTPEELGALTHPSRENILDALEARHRVHGDIASGQVSITIRDRDPALAARLATLFLYEMPYQRARDLGLHCELISPRPSAPEAYVYPRLPLHLAPGLAAGLFLGTLIAAIAARPRPAPAAAR